MSNYLFDSGILSNTENKDMSKGNIYHKQDRYKKPNNNISEEESTVSFYHNYKSFMSSKLFVVYAFYFSKLR